MAEKEKSQSTFEEIMRNKLKDIDIRKIEDCLSEAISKLFGIEYKIRFSSIEYAEYFAHENKAIITIEEVKSISFGKEE